MQRAESWMASNALRVRLLGGFFQLYLSGVALFSTNEYAMAVIAGFAGGLFIGGWRALRRFMRHPVYQSSLWVSILLNRRKTVVRKREGQLRLTEMEPTLHGWRSTGYLKIYTEEQSERLLNNLR